MTVCRWLDWVFDSVFEFFWDEGELEILDYIGWDFIELFLVKIVVSFGIIGGLC